MPPQTVQLRTDPDPSGERKARDALRIGDRLCMTSALRTRNARVSRSRTVRPLRRLSGLEKLYDMVPGECGRVMFPAEEDPAVHMETEGKRTAEADTCIVCAGTLPGRKGIPPDRAVKGESPVPGVHAAL